MIVSHLVLILAVLFSPIYAGVLVVDALSILAAVAPLFVAFTAAIIKHAIATSTNKKDTSPQVNGYFVTLTFFVPSIFCIAVYGVFLSFAFDWIEITADQTKISLAAVEAALAAFVGYFVDALFPPQVLKGKSAGKQRTGGDPS